eukprot:3306184-Amphidinium_carterae.2
MPVLASEAMRALSHEMVARAWRHLAIEEHETLEELLVQAHSWHERGVLFAEHFTDTTSEDCHQEDNFDDEEDK